MLFVHISDNHLGYRQYNLDEREKDFYKSFKECIDKILEIKPDVVLHCGDLFHDIRPPIKALKIVMREFKKLHEKGIKVYIVAGNHEMPRRRGEDSPLSLLKEYVRVLNGWDVINVDGEEIFICGTFYHRKSKRDLLIDKLNNFWSNAKSYRKNIVMLHQGVNPYLPYDYELEPFDLPMFSYYALGHVHKRILDRINDGIFAYSGSTEIVYRNEYEDYKTEGKGFYLVDFSKKDLDLSDIEKINIECREFIEVDIRDENSLKEAISKIINCKKDPVVFGKVIKDFRSFFNMINNRVLINKVRIIDNELVDFSNEIDIDSIDIKKLLLDYANKQGVDGNLVLDLYRILLNGEDWNTLLEKFYKEFDNR